jgi:hypothetical protein
VLETNTARHSVDDTNYLMSRWYYEAQAVMNVCASTLQSPESISQLLVEDRKGKIYELELGLRPDD